MKFWIPGVRGLVGSYLATQLTVPYVGSGHELDISDEPLVRSFLREHGPFTHIINCAAFSAVDPAETHREEAFKTNALGPEVLGKVAKEQGITLLHLSTDFVFSGEGKTMLKETDLAAPCNYYGYTKLEGERKLLAVNPEATILRTSSVYGTGGQNFVTKLIYWFQTKEELSIVDDQFSRPTYVPDLVSVILQIISYPGLYHFANQGAASKYEFARALLTETKKLAVPTKCHTLRACTTAQFPSPAKRPQYAALDTSKIEALLSLKPRHWHDTLSDYLRSLETIYC